MSSFLNEFIQILITLALLRNQSLFSISRIANRFLHCRKQIIVSVFKYFFLILRRVKRVSFKFGTSRPDYRIMNRNNISIYFRKLFCGILGCLFFKLKSKS